ncbi:MAG: HDOD domain-containing protein [Verrucomicrobiales bacterium]|nr:HDOD domain-containing protein [Verrucomicrobiales bacterium]
MKTRILFVDDEPLVLQGLQRMLRSARHEWEMEFVTSGHEALSRLENHTYDVVVSDMRMPGMDGAQLLTEVMRRYPRTARFVLSGHADRDLIMRGLDAIHQFMTKPCDLEILRSTIHRAHALQETLRTEGLRRLIGQIQQLPSLPKLYHEITSLLGQSEVDAAAVGAVVARDVSMTAKILKLVNSAFFGLGREISSPSEAVNYLGVETIKAIVLTLHAFARAGDESVPLSFMDALWSHSLEVAAGSRAITEAEDAPRRTCDEAFAAGILHDVGKLILRRNFPEEYVECSRIMGSEGLPAWRAELLVFGASHADLGGYLLGLWGLPNSVVDAIAFHHTPDKAGRAEFGPLAALHVANALLPSRAEGGPSSKTHETLDLDYLQKTQRADHLPLWNRALGLESTRP